MKVQAEQEVQWVFGGPQASNCVDANIVVLKASLGASHQSPCLLYLNLIYNTICLCIKFIGVRWQRRYIKTSLPDYPCYHYYNSCMSLEMARRRHRCR
jgi:hypothetical protein